MCTVTFIPKGKDHFIFTSNRDEAPDRAADEVKSVLVNQQKIVFPEDKRSGGTWLAISDNNRLICVLNGAFEKHQRKSVYRRSRGLMALDFFSFTDIHHFGKNYMFKGMEPFTVIVYENFQLFELRWDEERLHSKSLNPFRSYIWSSSTLYDRNMRAKRQKWFNGWIRSTTNLSQSNIINLHQRGGEGNPHVDYVMNRNEKVKTVSITSVHKNPQIAGMTFIDLQKNQTLIPVELELG